MEIELPNKKNSERDISIDNKSFVVIGVKGYGKTRFCYKIKKN